MPLSFSDSQLRAVCEATRKFDIKIAGDSCC
jgi:hypothetical protein